MGEIAERRCLHAAELVAFHGHDEYAVDRVIEGKSPISHLLGDPELAAKFHGPDADLQHLRRADLVVALFDEGGLDATSAQVRRKSQADRAPANNQNGRLGCLVTHLQS